MSGRAVFVGAGLLLACTPRPTADLTATNTPPAVSAPETSKRASADPTAPRWVSLSIESEFGCGVERSGAVQCWGRGPDAEMGLRELPEQPPPESMVYGTRRWGPASRLEFLTDARAVSTAPTLVCAIVEDGRIRCWGAVRWGSSHVYDVAGISGAVELEIGEGEACAKLENHELWCWGADDHGIAQPRLAGTTAFAVGDNLACGLGESGDVVCWGQAIADWHRYSAQIRQQQGISQAPLFQPNSIDEPEWPDTVEVGRFRGALDIALTGWNSLCVLRGEGKVACASQDVAATLRNEELGLREIVGAEGLVDLVATRSHVCGRTLDDRALCWGRNVYGQLGDGGASSRDSAAPVAGLSGVVGLAVAEDLSCASTQAGQLHCWGFDRAEALARETTHVHTLSGVAASSIAAYGRTTCVAQAGENLCWGGDSLEQAGILELAQPRKLALPSGGEIVALSTGWEGCVLQRGGALHCGNWNTQSSLSLSVTTTQTDVHGYAAGPPPTCTIVGAGSKATLHCGPSFTLLTPERQIDAPTRVAAVGMRACVVHGGGKVSCFGELHQWGAPNTGPREITRIEGIRDATDIASSSAQDCVLRKSGKVSCWVGRVDTEWTADGRAPKAIRYVAAGENDMGLEKVVQLVAGAQNHCALTSNAAVRCWADSPYAETTDWRPVPPLPDDVVELAAGSEHTCARTRGGQVTCWGDDVSGQLGRVPSRVYLRATTLPTDGP